MEKRSEQHSKELLNLHNYLARETRGSGGRESCEVARWLTRRGPRRTRRRRRRSADFFVRNGCASGLADDFGCVIFSFLVIDMYSINGNLNVWDERKRQFEGGIIPNETTRA